MISPEVFYLHLHGEQRGPYTVPQIDHLLNSGLIAEETLYWCEGLEQWQPVTSLVIRRKTPNPWVKPMIALACALVLVLFGNFFGPIAVVGWRELHQNDFTDRAAYWRARDAVRHGGLPAGALVEFGDFKNAEVTLDPSHVALVVLRGEVTEPDGRARAAAWQVGMRFNPADREWSSLSTKEIAAR